MYCAGMAQAETDVRLTLDRIIQERGEDYVGLSRLIGRNAAYIQQFVKRGSPRRLAERDRKILADYLRVDESLLGGPANSAMPATIGDLVIVPRLAVGAAAGAGSHSDSDALLAQHAFDARWLRSLSGSPQRLSIISVEGDSMSPTLNHGDEIMVDAGDVGARLRDGIYVLRRDAMLLVKRLVRASRTAAAHVNIVSDNSVYPPEMAVPLADVEIVGRVVWAGRRIS